MLTPEEVPAIYVVGATSADWISTLLMEPPGDAQLPYDDSFESVVEDPFESWDDAAWVLVAVGGR